MRLVLFILRACKNNYITSQLDSTYETNEINLPEKKKVCYINTPVVNTVHNTVAVPLHSYMERLVIV